MNIITDYTCSECGQSFTVPLMLYKHKRICNRCFNDLVPRNPPVSAEHKATTIARREAYLAGESDGRNEGMRSGIAIGIVFSVAVFVMIDVIRSFA